MEEIERPKKAAIRLTNIIVVRTVQVSIEISLCCISEIGEMDQRIPRFQLLELIGEGQFSKVYKARMILPSEQRNVNSASSASSNQPTNGNETTSQSNDQVQLLDFNAEPLNPQEVSRQDSISGAFNRPNQGLRQQQQQHETGGKFVALKKIKYYEIQNSKMRMDFDKEIKLMQQLNHPNIINYSISFIQGNEKYIVLELADGGDLSKLIRYFQRRNEFLSEKIILKYFSQVCSAVKYIHSKRILHRDIKPANIFMTSDGCVKLGDFGLGRFFGQNTCNAHSYVGTFFYMSPERVQQLGYDFSSDVWSLGCVLYELITLRSPFDTQRDHFNIQLLIDRICMADYPSLVRYTNISIELRQLATKCLSLMPFDRPNMDSVCCVVDEVHKRLLASQNKANVAL